MPLITALFDATFVGQFILRQPFYFSKFLHVLTYNVRNISILMTDRQNLTSLLYQTKKPEQIKSLFKMTIDYHFKSIILSVPAYL